MIISSFVHNLSTQKTDAAKKSSFPYDMSKYVGSRISSPVIVHDVSAVAIGTEKRPSQGCLLQAFITLGVGPMR